jgi:hypothetical protein
MYGRRPSGKDFVATVAFGLERSPLPRGPRTQYGNFRLFPRYGDEGNDLMTLVAPSECGMGCSCVDSEEACEKCTLQESQAGH